MSAKNFNQNHNKKNGKSGKRIALLVTIAVLVVILVVELLLWGGPHNTQNPDETKEVTETQGVTENQETTETQGSAETQEVSVTEAPDETQEVNVTEAPDETQEVNVTEAPDETQEVSVTEAPDETQEVSVTEAPDETQEVSVTEAPVETQEVSKPPVPDETQPQNPAIIEKVEETTISLGYGLSITDVGKYTGVYMEDGSDEIVSGVLMIVVNNSGEETIQYAEITLPLSGGEAKFSLSTLPAGQSVVLLEQNRLEWSASEDYASAAMEHVAVFSEPLSLCEDQLKLQILDGAINVTNISGTDIAGDIVIYYKNSATDLYYGGITYRVRIEGGMSAGEVKQIMASHFSDTGSAIMFVTISQ